jgi:hypothetical protein
VVKRGIRKRICYELKNRNETKEKGAVVLMAETIVVDHVVGTED